MARRKNHTREELYDLALEYAGSIMAREGFRALTARKVANAIGYSPGTLYNVFENFDDLILRLNGRTLDALYDELAPLPVTGRPHRDLKVILEGYLDFIGRHPNLWQAVTDFRLSDGHGLPDWYERKVARPLGLVEQALAPACNGEEAREAARVLWAGLYGICSLSDQGKLTVLSMQDVRSMAEILVSNFVVGLEARNSKPK